MSGIKRILHVAKQNVDDEIHGSINRDNRFSAGLAREGYLGGYSDALSDVLLALNGNVPHRRGWWESKVKP